MESEKSMEIIVWKFRCCTPVKTLKWDVILRKASSLELQRELVQKTVADPMVLDFPMKFSYQQNFLKELINRLERHAIEVHDDVYRNYCRILHRTGAEPEYSYKHYAVLDGDSSYVVLKENNKLIAEGTTGLRTWEASLVLAEWCLQNKEALAEKCVLELGAGVGLASIVVGRFCYAKRVWATDCHGEVLKILGENVECNCDEDREEPPNVDVLNLPWDEICSIGLPKGIPMPDVVLAADVVFDPSLFDVLSGAISYFLEGNRRCRVILACTVRNEDTLKEFLLILERKSLKAVELNQVTSTKIYYLPSTKANLYEISNMCS